MTETANTPRSLPLLNDPNTDAGDSGGCGCGGCGCGTAAADLAPSRTPISPQEGSPMTTQTYHVSGMTCGHCASAVTSELRSLPGVTDVHVDLVAGGTSEVTVTSQGPLEATQLTASLDEAGDYQLVQR